MAKTLKEPVQEKIEIVDQLDDMAEPKGSKLRFLLPLIVLVLAAISTFLWIRRHSAKNELN